jgi:putative transposase
VARCCGGCRGVAVGAGVWGPWIGDHQAGAMDMPGMQRGHRLRKFRISEEDRIYLITVVTKNRRPLFADWVMGGPVVTALRQAQENGEAVSLCWVVMPDHLHWVMALRGTSLSRVVGGMKSRSTVWFNRENGGGGAIWQSGFHDRALRREDDLKTLARYVVHNPVRAGLVRNVREYCLWDAVWV